MKRFFDISISILLIPFLVVSILVFGSLIFISSGRPIFYFSKRVGQYGQFFFMPKFRTMKNFTPELPTETLSCPENYITPIGKFLRKTSLDEVPQIYSVLIGQMSFVGPRPALPTQTDLNALREKGGVHSLKPGITGLAQINGRDKLSDVEKTKMDIEYLKRISLLTDIKIILITVLKVVKFEGIKH